MEKVLIIIQTINLDWISVCTIINDVSIVRLISGPSEFSKCIHSYKRF